jgi:uncharacterized protein (DUF983 family)
MNPVVKYTLGRIGLFALCAAILVAVPVPVNLWIKLMVALLASVVLQFVVLRSWRVEMIGYVDQAMARRRDEREKLRAALAGEDHVAPVGQDEEQRGA